jgi:glutamate-1-semialdehyde 2,1-aminomutase
MRCVGIIQARMTSSRLPGKVLLTLAGSPVLEHVARRLATCRMVDEVVVATSDHAADDPIQAFCDARDISCFRGSMEDVLDRHVQAARQFAADYVVRITADCPVFDGTVVDALVTGAVAGAFDCYGLIGEFPDGLDCTVYRFAALERAGEQARLASDREHVSRYLEKNPALFRNGGLPLFHGLAHHRWTLDEPEDLRFLEAVFERLDDPLAPSLTAEILALLEDHPELARINGHVVRNEGYRRSLAADGEEPVTAEDRAGQRLYEAAKRIIPGGTQLLSKRPEMFAPGIWPAYYSRAKGARVWDLDGREYTDMGIMAVGACILGYADDEVDDAVRQAIARGVNCSLNCPEEVELGQALCELHPWFDMVRYARGGGEAMSMAIRIARASTGRDLVLFSGYHGWADWYLAANLADDSNLDGHLMPGLEPRGVPRGLAGSAVPFRVEDIDSLRAAMAGREREVAAIVVEPARAHDAPVEYLSALRDVAAEVGAVLVFDEITSAFRMCAGGIHRRYGVEPDMAVFAKSMANGYAMAAVLGTERVMQAAQTTFISSTNWTENTGPAAALATLRKYRRERVQEHIIDMGDVAKAVWRTAAANAGLQITTTGLPTLAGFGFVHPQARDLATRFVIEMLRRGFLACHQFKPSFAHTAEDVRRYGVAVDEVFRLLRSLPENRILDSPPAHSGFHRLTKE